MRLNYSILIKLLILQYLSVLCLSKDFDFFYFVLQEHTVTQHSSCYPETGKPATDFTIHGLWPEYKDGLYPSNCDPNSVFEKSRLSDLMTNLQKDWPSLSCPSSNGFRFWSHEWEKHGTCSESQKKVNLLQILRVAIIEPDDGFYSLGNIVRAIIKGIGYTPRIECNKDSHGNSQLYQIYFCVDSSGSEIIECPVPPKRRCASKVQFPKF
ncbi:ribonuclease 3 [Quercus suber]|uniref:Ribonuclease 3 n=1 Tax=Quercus suber TaxID=58331 RepID=A0AAW0KL68_QUESU